MIHFHFLGHHQRSRREIGITENVVTKSIETQSRERNLNPILQSGLISKNLLMADILMKMLSLMCMTTPSIFTESNTIQLALNRSQAIQSLQYIMILSLSTLTAMPMKRRILSPIHAAKIYLPKPEHPEAVHREGELHEVILKQHHQDLINRKANNCPNQS